MWGGRVAAALAVLALSGCDRLAPEEFSADFSEDLQRNPVPTWDEFEASVTQMSDGSYVVEGDIELGDEEHLFEYYEQRYLRDADKSIVGLLSTGVRNRRPGSSAPSGAAATNIRYCFGSANWGQPIPPPPPGLFSCGGSFATLEPSRTNIQQAMRQWEFVANVNFVLVTSLDGTAQCTTSGTNPGVDFVIEPYDSRPITNCGCGTSTGAFPNTAFSAQRLRVGACGVTEILAEHELGHILGFWHEFNHSGGPRMGAAQNTTNASFCDDDPIVFPGTTNPTWEELTAYDVNSVMNYQNCANSQIISGFPIGQQDGLGAREVYGSPAFWLPAYASSLIY